MHLHEIVKIDASAFSAVHCFVTLWMGAADLRFLHRLPQALGTPNRTAARESWRWSQSWSQSWSWSWLRPFVFRSSYQRVPHYITNFGNRAPGHETQTIDRGDGSLDPPDAGSGPGTRRRRAGSEKGRFPAAGLVRRAAGTVAFALRRRAPCGAGKADADSAILDLPADRPAGGRGAGGAPRVQDRQARPVCRDYRGRARTAEEDVERLFGGHRKACWLEIVRCGRSKALRPAGPAGLLVR